MAGSTASTAMLLDHREVSATLVSIRCVTATITCHLRAASAQLHVQSSDGPQLLSCMTGPGICAGQRLPLTTCQMSHTCAVAAENMPAAIHTEGEVSNFSS